MWKTIGEYCEDENITRSTYNYRVAKGYISQDRLGRDDGNKITVWVGEGKPPKKDES